MSFQINSHRASIFMAKTIITVGISVYLLNKEETRESEILFHFEVDPSILIAIGYSGDRRASFASLILCKQCITRAVFTCF